MAKKEVRTDLWVADQLKACGIAFDPQGSSVMEIDKALKGASKQGTGHAGYPEFVAVIHDFVLVIEDKADTDKHVKRTDAGILDTSANAVSCFAVNGAYAYAKHIAKKSPFKKVFAVGVSGDPRHHKITPLWVDDREGYRELPELESFISFSPKNIREYYTRYVLEEDTDVEKATDQILKDAAELHEYLRTYGTLKDQDKPLVVAGILLALDEIEYGGFNIGMLTGDQTPGLRDGDKLMTAIRGRLTRSNVGPDAKKDKLLAEFAILQTSFRLNEINQTLGKTPLKLYTEFLFDHVFRNIKYQKTSEDFIGRFYGEFMSYSGGDGQTLGIVLTPKHICDLMCDLVDVQPDDVVLDPTCGTAGFLISAMHRMLSMAESETQRKHIKKNQLHGFELQSNMFAAACANMILRKDGNSNLACRDFLKENPAQLQMKGATVGLMNPPYSQGSKDDPSQYEISFVEHMLDSLTIGGCAAVIVPQSTMTGKSRAEQKFKESILKHHTLEGVVTCNTNTFYGVGTNPVIAVFTAHEPHPADKLCKFIDFRDDGFEVRPHIGLVEGDSAKDKRQHLLDVWNALTEAPSKFCVESTVKPDDEWLHSFFYFNDEIPTDEDFEKAIGDYLTFEFSMVVQNREYLFKGDERVNDQNFRDIPDLAEKKWEKFKAFGADGMFSISATKSSIDGIRLIDGTDKVVPYVTRSDMNNGISRFVSRDNMTYGFDDAGRITVGLDTQTAFWQPHSFVTGQNIQVITGNSLNEYVAQFLIPLLRAQMKAKFNWGGNGATLGRMKTLKLMLPVNDSGEPDFEYMEQYVKNLMLKKYRQYLSFLDRRSK